MSTGIESNKGIGWDGSSYGGSEASSYESDVHSSAGEELPRQFKHKTVRQDPISPNPFVRALAMSPKPFRQASDPEGTSRFKSRSRPSSPALPVKHPQPWNGFTNKDVPSSKKLQRTFSTGTLPAVTASVPSPSGRRSLAPINPSLSTQKVPLQGGMRPRRSSTSNLLNNRALPSIEGDKKPTQQEAAKFRLPQNPDDRNRKLSSKAASLIGDGDISDAIDAANCISNKDQKAAMLKELAIKAIADGRRVLRTKDTAGAPINFDCFNPAKTAIAFLQARKHDKAVIHSKLAVAYAEFGRIEMAEAHLAQVTEVSYKLLPQVTIAGAKVRMGKIQEATQIAESIATIPDFNLRQRVWLFHCIVLFYVHTGRTTAADEVIRTQFKSAHERANIYLTIADMLFEFNDVENGTKYLEKVPATSITDPFLNKKHAAARTKLALLHARQGNHSIAYWNATTIPDAHTRDNAYKQIMIPLVAQGKLKEAYLILKKMTPGSAQEAALSTLFLNTSPFSKDENLSLGFAKMFPKEGEGAS